MNIAENTQIAAAGHNGERHDTKAGGTGAEPLRRLFYPHSVALVGASERSPWSQLLHANIRRVGFAGRIHAVNKTGAAAHGYPGYRSCREIPETVDCAYLLVPLEAVLDAFDDVAASGIKSAVILTSGFAEAGAEGARLQDELTRRARGGGDFPRAQLPGFCQSRDARRDDADALSPALSRGQGRAGVAEWCHRARDRGHGA